MATFFTLPVLFTIGSTLLFLLLERMFPGRELPNSEGWYGRALLLNLVQMAISFGFTVFWMSKFAGYSLFHLSNMDFPVIEAFIGWFIGTFFFYWWHRLRHVNGFWHVFHQIHHSPSRIEVLTSFYKHPLEILADAFLSSVILYFLLGCSLEAVLWYNFFAATGEYFYHANIRTPGWLRYFIQTPELHSVHHELDVHNFNYSDIPLWDRLFGTYKDTREFAAQCGFPGNNETKIWKMMFFKDVYQDKGV